MCAFESHIHRVFSPGMSGLRGRSIAPRGFTSRLPGKKKYMKGLNCQLKWEFYLHLALSPDFKLGRQEDSHELLMCLLNNFQKAALYGLG